MNSKLRRYIAKYYWSIMIVVFLFACGWIYLSPRTRDDITLVITVIGSMFSFFFVIQKQASEDIRLFKELFTNFNQRYNMLNEDLNRIEKKKPTSPLTKEEKDILNDYFNLCGEEYLYYLQGFILPEVWKAWCNGMWFFFKSPRIKPVWTSEEKSSSYYGLTLEIIMSEVGNKETPKLFRRTSPNKTPGKI